MTDIIGPLRPSDSWSTTEIRSLQHSHVWAVRGFSQCDCRYLETSAKIRETALSNPNPDSCLTFRIRLHPQGNKESNKDFTFFQVFCNTNSTKYLAKFSVFNAKNEEAQTTVYNGTQQLHGYFEYIRRDTLLAHIQPQDELQLVLNLTVRFDTVTKTSQTQRPSCLPEPKLTEIARDMEVFFREGRLSDFTIIASGREMRAHRAILSARSPVFAAMLEPHTEEYKNSQVNFADIDYEIMYELLTYIYTGRSPNLSNMALDLLANADRFQLTGLKEMADQFLRNGITVESACRYLVFADMHNAQELKTDALRFIAQNSGSVILTDGWAQLVKQDPALVTEVVSAIAAADPHSSVLNTSSSSGTLEPTPKRCRLGEYK